MAKEETVTLTDKLDKDWRKIQNLVSQKVIEVKSLFKPNLLVLTRCLVNVYLLVHGNLQ